MFPHSVPSTTNSAMPENKIAIPESAWTDFHRLNRIRLIRQSFHSQDLYTFQNLLTANSRRKADSRNRTCALGLHSTIAVVSYGLEPLMPCSATELYRHKPTETSDRLLTALASGWRSPKMKTISKVKKLAFHKR